MRYWIRVAKQTRGPFTAEDIRQQPAVTEVTPVCPEGAKSSADWRRLGEVPELVAALRGLPAPPSILGESKGQAGEGPASATEKPRDLRKIVLAALRAAGKRK